MDEPKINEAKKVKSKFERRISNVREEKFPLAISAIYRFWNETRSEKILNPLIQEFEKNKEAEKQTNGATQGSYRHPQKPYERAIYGYYCLKKFEPYDQYQMPRFLSFISEQANDVDRYRVFIVRYCFIAYFEYVLDYLDQIIHEAPDEKNESDNSKIFISWSGEESKEIARLFIEGIKTNFGEIETFFTPVDLKHGKRWEGELAKELERARYGVLILTKDNHLRPWINFEAGAISKHFEKSRVWPVCFGFSKNQLEEPLSEFHAADFSKEEVKKLSKELVELTKGQNGEFEKEFEKFWIDFEPKVENVIRNIPSSEKKQGEFTDFLSARAKDGPARFREPNEPIGIQDRNFMRPERDIFIPSGAAIWLRTMPTVKMQKDWTISELKKFALDNSSFLSPLIRPEGGYSYLRAQDGIGWFYENGIDSGDGNGKTIDGVAFAFKTGEIWGLDTVAMKYSKDQVFAKIIENMFETGLNNYSQFLSKFGVTKPYHWKAGLVGLKGRSLFYDPPPGQIWTPGFKGRTFASNLIEGEGTVISGQSIFEALKPFFEKIFDDTGEERPGYLSPLHQ